MTRVQRLLLCGALLAACKKADKTPPPPPPAATKVGQVDSLQTPESAQWDSAQDVYFVSNTNGNASVKDGNGFISRVRPDGSI